MTSHVRTCYDHEQMIYDQQNYTHTTTYHNEYYHSPLPIPSIDVCDNLLYENRPTSSFINSNCEHYDNTFMHMYDNPNEYRENYSFQQSLIRIPEENIYDNTKLEVKPTKKSSIVFYFENKRFVLLTCLIFISLLILIALGIFFFNKFFRPVVIQTTVNHHYDLSNTTNLVTTTTTLAPGNLPFPYSTCPSDRWGSLCQNICKPCGLGVCHSVTGKCICPVDIYGEFCDLWKVNDQPKRGDMTS